MAAGQNFSVWDKNDPDNRALTQRLDAEAKAKAAIYELARQNNFYHPAPEDQIRNHELMALVDHLESQPNSLQGLESLVDQMRHANAVGESFKLGFFESLGV